MARRDDDQSGARTQQAFNELVRYVATIVRIVGALFALVLALQIIFTVFSANPQNGIVQFIGRLAGPLTLGFDNMFTPANVKLAVAVNDGIAAIVWLVVTLLLARLLRRLAG